MAKENEEVVVEFNLFQKLVKLGIDLGKSYNREKVWKPAKDMEDIPLDKKQLKALVENEFGGMSLEVKDGSYSYYLRTRKKGVDPTKIRVFKASRKWESEDKKYKIKKGTLRAFLV